MFILKRKFTQGVVIWVVCTKVKREDSARHAKEEREMLRRTVHCGDKARDDSGDMSDGRVRCRYAGMGENQVRASVTCYAIYLPSHTKPSLAQPVQAGRLLELIVRN